MSNKWDAAWRQGDRGCSISKLGPRLDGAIRLMMKRYFRTGRAPGKWGEAIANECRRVMPETTDPATAPSYLIDRVVANLCDRSRSRWLGAMLPSTDAETVRC